MSKIKIGWSEVSITPDKKISLEGQFAENGHYSAFLSSGQVGHEAGDLLVRQTLKNVNEMF